MGVRDEVAAGAQPRLLVDGKLTEAGRTFPAVNPATGEILGHAPDAGPAEAKAAAQLRCYAGRTATEPGAEIMACAGHRALAREVAARSMVLLRNEPVAGLPVLPLDPAATERVAVVAGLRLRRTWVTSAPPGSTRPVT
jgi:hypothetical protein